MKRTTHRLLALTWMFLLASSIGLQAQTAGIYWNESVHQTYAENVNEGSSEASDIYFYFEVQDGPITSGKVVITLPYAIYESFDLVKFPVERLGGNADLGTNITLSSSDRVLTFNNVNLAAGSSVWYRIPRYLKTQYNGIRALNSPTTKVRIQVYRTGSTLATNGDRNDLAYNYQYANLQAIDPPLPLPPNQQTGLQMDFGDNNGVKTTNPTAQTFQFGIQCTGGQIDSLTLTVKFPYGGVTLSNWNVDGTAIPEDRVTSSFLDGTVILDDIIYTVKIRKQDIPGGKGLADGVTLPLSVDVVKDGCGGLNVNYSTVWAEQANIKSLYTSTNTGSFNANIGAGYQPQLKSTLDPTRNDTGNLFCQNGELEMSTFAVTNTGLGQARNIQVTYTSSGPSVIDTSALRVRVGKYGTPVRVKKINITRSQSGNNVKSEYRGLPNRILVELDQTLLPNAADTLYFDCGTRCYSDLAIAIPGINFLSTSVVGAVALGYRYTDECSSQTYSIVSTSYFLSGTSIGLTIAAYDTGINLGQNTSEVYSYTLDVSPFSAGKVTTDNAKLVTTVKLPKGLEISGGAPDIKVYRSGYESNPWPVANFQTDIASDPDSIIYTFELINSTRKGITNIKTTTGFIVDINITNTCNPAVNGSGRFKISLAFYPTGSIGGGCADVVYDQVQLYPTFVRQCVNEHVTYDFDFRRTGIIGLRDANDDQIPDGTDADKALESDGADFKEILPGDTVRLSWNATVLGNDNKKYLYAVLFSEGSSGYISVIDGGVPVNLELDGDGTALQAVPRNTVLAGNILQPYDRGNSNPAERYAYVWELSKKNGTDFTDQETVNIAIQMKTPEVVPIFGSVKRNITSWMYATTAALPDIPAILSPGADRKGLEVHQIVYPYVSMDVSGPTKLLTFSGPQALAFNGSLFYINGFTQPFSPYEYRHLTTLDSIVYEVPTGYIISNTLPFNVRTTNSSGGNVTSPLITITASTEGNLPNRKTFVFGEEVFDVNRDDPSKIPLPDGYYNIIATTDFTITATPSAPVGTTNWILTAYTDNKTYTQVNIPVLGIQSTGYTLQRTSTLTYIDPGSLRVVSTGAITRPAVSPDLSYDVALQNTKTDGNAFSSWMYIQGPVKDAQILVGGVTYSGTGEGNRWVELPEVAMNTASNGVLSFEYLGSPDCGDQEVKVYPLMDRIQIAQGAWDPEDGGIPKTDAGFTAGQQELTTLQYIGPSLNLKIENPASSISGSIT
ncbi:MAG: hypothetical protein LBJ72_12170, partial [Dysgonamonadaceae bacterium]|nr:hypothetical protein [Dysgonamonadaceae bacterium]